MGVTRKRKKSSSKAILVEANDVSAIVQKELLILEVEAVIAGEDPDQPPSIYIENDIDGTVEDSIDSKDEGLEDIKQGHKDRIIERTNESDDIDFEQPLTERESLVLELYFTGRIDLEKSVKMAGYKTRSKAGRYYIGKRIVEKLEGSGSAKDIFRRAGLGEVCIATQLCALIMNPKAGSNARIAALNVASKCLGLQKEVFEGGEGCEIIISAGAKTGNGPSTGETGACKAAGGAVREMSIVK